MIEDRLAFPIQDLALRLYALILADDYFIIPSISYYIAAARRVDGHLQLAD